MSQIHLRLLPVVAFVALTSVFPTSAYDGYYGDLVSVVCDKADPIKAGEEVVFTASSPNPQAWITLDVSGGEVAQGETSPKTGVGGVSIRVTATTPGVGVLIAHGSTTSGMQAEASRSVYRLNGVFPNPVNIPAVSGRAGTAIVTFIDDGSVYRIKEGTGIGDS